MDLLQQVHILIVLGAPELDAVLQVRSHERRVWGQNLLPWTAGQTSFHAAQDMVGVLGCKSTLPGHVELLINQHPQVFLLRVALNPFSVQPVLVFGIAPTQMQDLALGLLEPHEVCKGPPLQPVKVPLDGLKLQIRPSFNTLGSYLFCDFHGNVHLDEQEFAAWLRGSLLLLIDVLLYWMSLLLSSVFLLVKIVKILHSALQSVKQFKNGYHYC